MARSDEIYGGAWGRTRTEAIHVSCSCGYIFASDVHRSINVTRDPALGARLRDGSLGQSRCPSCGATVNVEVPVVYHDESRRQLILVLPPGLRHRELEERAELLLALARDRGFAVPFYARELRCVFGPEELTQAAASTAENSGMRRLEERAAELERLATSLAQREGELAELSAALHERRRELAAVSPGIPVDDGDAALTPIVETALYGDLADGGAVHTVVEESTNRFALGGANHDSDRSRPIPTTGSALLRWQASGVEVMHSVENGDVRLLLRGPPGPASHKVRVSLFRVSTYPLIVIGLGHSDDGEPTPVFFDLERPEDRQALGILAASFHLIMDYFDDAYEPLARREVILPLAANVRYALSLADEHLTQIPMARRSFEAAVAAWRAPSFDRWGRRDPRLDEDSFAVLPTPAAAQKALGVVAGWSEPSNEDYLILVRSFPVEWWRRIRSHVIHRGVELGLLLPGVLLDLALSEGLYRSRKELVSRTLTAFATLVAGRETQNDLDAEQTAANWRALFILCDDEAIAVDGRIAELARAAGTAVGGMRPPMVIVQPRKDEASSLGELGAGGAYGGGRALVRPATRSAREETGRIVVPMDAAATTPTPARAGDDLEPSELVGKPDYRAAVSAELLDLLEDKDLRLGAALELSRRTEPLSVGPIFGAVRRMTRGEAVRVIPAVIRFGERAVPHLVDLLRSRKAYLRQGSALALGILKSADGIDALCELLVNEPTDIWKEVARAIGEIGGGAVMSLATRLRDPDIEEGDTRERITWALAHVAAKGARGQIEALAAGRGVAAAGAARQALELGGLARENDDEVRGPMAPHDQTVNRAFSRRFFESLYTATPAATGLSELEDDLELSSGSVSLDEEPEILEADEEMIEEEDILPS